MVLFFLLVLFLAVDEGERIKYGYGFTYVRPGGFALTIKQQPNTSQQQQQFQVGGCVYLRSSLKCPLKGEQLSLVSGATLSDVRARHSPMRLA